MAALSNSDRKRFTPAHYEGREGAPVYLIAPLGWRERGRWRAALAELGVRFPQDKEIADTVVKLIEEIEPDNKAELLAVVEAFRDLHLAEVLKPLPDDASDEAKGERQAEIDRRVAIAAPFDDVVDLLRTSSRLSRLFGMRVLFNETAAPLAAAYALRGWEGVDVGFRRVDGIVPDELLNALPQGDLQAIGTEVIAAIAVTVAQRGN